MRFDLLILGDTPDAWAAAEAAALIGQRVAVLRPDTDGLGVELQLAAVLAAYGDTAFTAPAGVTESPRDLCLAASHAHERTIRRLGRELNVRYWRGPVRRTGPTAAEVVVDGVPLAIEAHRVLIAVGTTAMPANGLPMTGPLAFTPEDVANLAVTPGRLIVLGGDSTARAFARLFIAAGSDVTLIDRAANEAEGFTGRVSGEVLDVQQTDHSVAVRLVDGREFEADSLLLATGRRGATARLGLETTGLETDDEGRLWCDDDGRTWVATVAAIGDSVGFPQRLRTSTTVSRTIRALVDLPPTFCYEPRTLAVA